MNKSKTDQETTYSISQLAEELDIAPSAIRYYEKHGLITPARSSGNQRIYTKRNRARLKLITRGKNLGFSLDEIAEMIGHQDGDFTELEQIEQSLAFGESKLLEIRSKIEELKLLEKEILSFRKKLLGHRKSISKD